MSDMPKSASINEEGPREGFQIESGAIPTARKIELIDALSKTGLTHMQIVSFVDPKRVPGMGIANAYAGLEMGVDMYDASVAGLGGCPFAGHKGAAGNVCTEDLVFMCEEMGIATGIDLERLLECARLAEDIVGHPLPGSVKLGGSLGKLRAGARRTETERTAS
ncbi:MAG: hypothetical protein A3F74_23980 [Betaproteobacteria bacterium RIFCSPLOWO2_12_FULL_62_58]|nr:MAG: hypothetical protein A3F74_23980 [Betaproteobacteria bacterium RIFCSPLOWO2_12_FULL_62_58]